MGCLNSTNKHDIVHKRLVSRHPGNSKYPSQSRRRVRSSNSRDLPSEEDPERFHCLQLRIILYTGSVIAISPDPKFYYPKCPHVCRQLYSTCFSTYASLNVSPVTPDIFTVRAIYDYNSNVKDDLTFHRGETIVIESKPNADWWLGRSFVTGKCGYVPSNFICSVENASWYFGRIRRQDAVSLLLAGSHAIGTFLIRDRETSDEGFSLSIRDYDSKFHRHIVKHYRIHRDNPSGLYISPERRFSDLMNLVEFYHNSPQGLCRRLTRACPRPKPVREIRRHLDPLEIDRRHLTFCKKIGYGQFGEVFSGWYKNEVRIAIKSLKPNSMDSESFIDEAKIMKNLRHDNVVRLLAVCTLEEPIYIITELMEKGSLLQFLKKGEGQYMRISDLICKCAEIALGMEYMESKNYIHRDLAARNILVNESNVCKIADFGLARCISDSEYTTRDSKTTKFPIKWTAPEAYLYEKFTIKSDVWSFGVLLIEVVTRGETPYPGMDKAIVLQLVQKGYRMQRPKDCPEKLYDCILQMWNANPQLRPSFADLVCFLQDFYQANDFHDFLE